MCSLTKYKFNSVKNIIQVIDSIPWVRCASGIVLFVSPLDIYQQVINNLCQHVATFDKNTLNLLQFANKRYRGFTWDGNLCQDFSPSWSWSHLQLGRWRFQIPGWINTAISSWLILHIMSIWFSKSNLKYLERNNPVLYV